MDRNQRRRIGLLALVGLALTCVVGCGGSGSPTGREEQLPNEFTRVDLGRVPTEFTKVAINASGDVALTRDVRGGYAFPVESDGSTYYAYCLTRDGWKNLHPGVGGASVAVDINDRGQVALFSTEQPVYYDPNTNAKRAYLYSDGTFTEIRPDGIDVVAVEPTRLSADGSVVGSYVQRSGVNTSLTQGFLWRNGETTTLPGFPLDINASGQILLAVPLPDGVYGTEQAIRQPDGQTVPLSDLVPEGAVFTATGINDDGSIVGRAGERPALLRDGVIIPVFVSAEPGQSEGINTAGDIYGEVESGPFLRRASGELVYLGPYMPFHSPSENLSGTCQDMNDRGQMVGSYNRSYGGVMPSAVAYLLTPPSLASNTGSASVKLSAVKAKEVDPTPFVAATVTGTLVTPKKLEVLVSTRTRSSGYRSFSVSLSASEPIEAGKTYPAVNFTYVVGPGVRVGFHSYWNGGNTFSDGRHGSLIVDSITNEAITFRLVNLQMDNSDICFGSGCDDTDYVFVLNATITVRR